MELNDDTYRVCDLCGIKRPLDLFWHSKDYEEVDEICSICRMFDGVTN